jgi:hypothetical protein
MKRSDHLVFSGPDVDQSKAAQIRAALAERFPPGAASAFHFKLMPLTVGAWLMIIAGQNVTDCDVLACGSEILELEDVLTTADALVARWCKKRALL